MRWLLAVLLLALGLAAPAFAQTNVVWGLTSGNNVCVYDQSPSRVCVTLGLLNSTSHLLTLTGPGNFSSLLVSGAPVATTSGALINGGCVSVNSLGQLVTTGPSCTAGGTVTTALAGQIAYYVSAGNVVSGATTGTGVLTALGNAAGVAGGFALQATLGTAASQNIGTSGATVPLLSTANNWALAQTFQGWVNLGYNSGGLYPPAGGAGGSLGSNFTNGGAEVDFFNTDIFSPATSFNFYQMTAANAVTRVLSISPKGALTAGQIALTAPPFTGSVSTTTDLNPININSDTIAASGTNYVNGFTVNYFFGGGAMTGARQAGLFALTQIAPSNSSSIGREYNALTGVVDAGSNDNGTVSAPSGAFGGGYFLAAAQAAATYLYTLNGIEIETNMVAGSSTAVKALLAIDGAAGDVSNGSQVNAMIHAYNEAGATSIWSQGILFDGVYDQWPFNSSSVIIMSKGTGTASEGIDFAATTFTGCAFRSKGMCFLDNLGVTYPPGSSTSTGYALSSNFSAGAGETVFWNTYYAAGTSFFWYQETAPGVATPLAALSPMGAFGATSFMAAGTPGVTKTCTTYPTVKGGLVTGC